MADEIVMKITLTIIGILVTSSVGYLAGKARTYSQKIKDKENNEQLQNIAIKTILKSQLTKTYFVYTIVVLFEYKSTKHNTLSSLSFIFITISYASPLFTF